MKSLQVIVSWIISLSVFIIIFWSSINIFLSKISPLKDAQIPQSTIDFFTGLANFVDVGVIFNPFPDLTDWGRYESIKDMKTIEDTCFIIFYSAKDSIKERSKADLALRYSNEAIPELEDFMKNYPYPYQVRNRKLPIYLAPSKGAYNSIIKQLGSRSSGGGSIGMYIYQISHMGTLAKGVVISPEAWDNKGRELTENEDLGLKKTLWHEINHYVYFTNFDYFNNTEPYLWFTEGCAEYFCDDDGNLKKVDKNKVHSISLSDNFTDNSVYWVGYTAFVYFEKVYGREALSNLVYYSYTNSMNTSLSNATNITLKDWEKGWKQDVGSMLLTVNKWLENNRLLYAE